MEESYGPSDLRKSRKSRHNNTILKEIKYHSQVENDFRILKILNQITYVFITRLKNMRSRFGKFGFWTGHGRNLEESG